MKIKILLALSLTLLLAASAFSQEITSVYTNLDDKSCRAVGSDFENGIEYRGRCPGVGGYTLELLEGDLRQTLNVIAPDKRKFKLNLMNISYAFSYVGAKAEWRLKGKTPIALIVRFNASEDVEDSSKVTSYLSVSKITPNEICLVDVVRPGKDQNEKARKLADAAPDKPCMQFE
jgi:hypothetical protein